MLKIFFCILLSLFSSQVFAAKDPISWQVSGTFPATVSTVGNSYSVTYTFTNQLPIQLINPLNIDKITSPANEFTYQDNCTGVRLTPQQTCTVRVILAPVVSGQKSLQVVIAGYSNDRVPLPILSTQAIGPVVTNGIVSGAVKQSLPGTLSVGSSANFSFVFNNTSSSPVTGVSVATVPSGLTSTCTSSLSGGGSCTVSGTYIPTQINPSIQTVSATYNYSQGSPVTVASSTSVPTETGVVGSLVSPFYLPPVMVGGAPNAKKVVFLFSNFESTTVNITSNNVVISGGTGATWTPGTDPGDDSCTGNLANGGAACQIVGTFTAPTESTPTSFLAQATITYTGGTGSSSNVSTSTTVVSALSTTRTVNFKNNCSFPVWFSLNGAALASPTGCPTNPCPTGSACNSSTGLCYWENYAPSSGGFELLTGDSRSVSIPLTNDDPTVQWSGNMAASTNCTPGTSCAEADCQNQGGNTACAPGVGFNQPATQAEITMNIASADSYDVETINGFSMPISMAPDSTVTANNYSCGVPGSAVAGNGFGACNWNGVTAGNLPNSSYYWVTSGGGSCSSCPSTQLCGLDSALDQVCGNFLGYWSADQACAVNASKANAFFNCNTPIPTSPSGPSFPANSVLQQLMACKVPKGYSGPDFNSCYQTYPDGTVTNTCCGCIDWWTLGIGANSTAQSCTKTGASSPQTDPDWNANIQSQIQWMKQACPSYYTYPFDDATSGFSCTNNLPGSANSVGYTITFCPDNGSGVADSGLPSTQAVDGRG